MKIDNHYYGINFGTSYRKVVKPSYTLGDCYEASTCFFKEDFPWNSFFDNAIKKYENTSKINIFSLACSDGSEAYSIAMLLISKLGLEKAQKYFPIIAVDFDKKITRNARKGFISLSANDELKINTITNNQLNKFMTRTDKSFISDKIGGTDKRELLTQFKINPILQDKVVFITEDINSYIDKIPNETNMIFCRNCWPYLWKTAEDFAQKLSGKIDKNSYLATGSYDFLLCPMTIKDCYGFTKHNKFEKVYIKSQNS